MIERRLLYWLSGMGLSSLIEQERLARVVPDLEVDRARQERLGLMMN